jgi:DNA mismatch repair protein MutL
VFANGRRIQDFSLLQALEYGVQGVFPNGTHPIGAVFIDIEPHLADFNIHPAKREVRFVEAGAIHHAITSSLRDFIHHLRISSDKYDQAYKQEFVWEPNNTYAGPPVENGIGAALHAHANNEASRLALEALRENKPPLEKIAASIVKNTASVTESAAAPQSLKYAGRVFDLFIIVEKGEKLFFIDQHAAHERILYDTFLEKPVPRQELLVSIPFSTESEEDDMFLASKKSDLNRLGIILTGGKGLWRIEALPVNWKLGDIATIKAVLDMRLAGENFAERWAATLACHTAVRDGSFIDEKAAMNLASVALALPVPFCPHGRPIWFEVSREFLYKAVKRE